MNEISVNYSATIEKIKLKSVYQYDHGLYLHIHGLNERHSVQIHYAIEGSPKAIRIIPEFKNNIWMSKIPDVLLAQSNDIHIYIYTSTADSGQTVMHLTVPIIKRPKPEDYQISDEEINAFDQLFANIEKKSAIIDETLSTIDQGVEDIELLKKQAQSALSSANSAITKADTAADKANAAGNSANNKAIAANSAAIKAENAYQSATSAAELADAAARAANTAVSHANQAAQQFELIKAEAEEQIDAVNKAALSIQNLTVRAITLGPESNAQASVENFDTGKQIVFSIPQGRTGPTGPVGPQGQQGPRGAEGKKGDTGNSGVYIGSSEPDDESIMVWIDEDGEADEDSDEDSLKYREAGIPVLDLVGDTTGMDRNNEVTLQATYTDSTANMALSGRTYYSDIGLTQVAGTTTTVYKAYWASDNARSFTINGVTYYIDPYDCAGVFEIKDTVTCKWQGSSSLWYPKKNYTIKFTNAFSAKEGWGLQKKYCLKANWVDSSNIRNLLGAYQWGRLVKSRANVDPRLSALPNGGAVDGFPVWVTINGKSAGLYTFNIPKDGWMFGMTGANPNEAIICEENYRFNTEALGDESDVEIEYSASDNATALANFNAMVRKVMAVQSEDDLPAFEEVFDVPSLVDYTLFASMICHHDGIVRNALFATYDGIKWFISAYDMDAIYGPTYDGSTYLHPLNSPCVLDIHTCAGGVHKLFDIVKKYYKTELESRLGAFIYDPGCVTDIRLYESAYNLAVKFPRALVNEDFRIWPSRPGSLTSDVNQILTFNRLRQERFKDGSDWNTLNIYKQIWG